MITVTVSDEADAVFSEYRRKFTFDQQVDALLEEMAELQHALLSMRKLGRPDAKPMDFTPMAEEVAEELADVQICLTQVIKRLGSSLLCVSDENVRRITERKIVRMAERIGI